MRREVKKDGSTILDGAQFLKSDADKLYLPKYQEYDSGWIVIGDIGAPAFVGGSPYGGAFGVPRFRRIGDVVYMEGLVANPPTPYNTIFTLPVGFRPDGDIIPASNGNAQTENHGIRVLASGVVSAGTGVTGWTSLACQFPVAGGNYTWHVIGAAGEPAFGSGWANFGGGFQTARFCKIGDYVYLSGLITRSTTATQIPFSLPVGYRNTNGNTHTPAAGTTSLIGTDAGVNIDGTTGSITCRGTGTGGWASLAGIRFFAGANDNKWKKFRGGADGWYLTQGAYGAPWPVPQVRRDGKIIFLEGLANVVNTGGFLRLPWGYASGQMDIRPVLNSTSRRLDTRGPNDADAAGGASTIYANATGVTGLTHSWVVADIFEGDIRWNS